MLVVKVGSCPGVERIKHIEGLHRSCCTDAEMSLLRSMRFPACSFCVSHREAEVIAAGRWRARLLAAQSRHTCKMVVISACNAFTISSPCYSTLLSSYCLKLSSLSLSLSSSSKAMPIASGVAELLQLICHVAMRSNDLQSQHVGKPKFQSQHKPERYGMAWGEH